MRDREWIYVAALAAVPWADVRSDEVRVQLDQLIVQAVNRAFAA